MREFFTDRKFIESKIFVLAKIILVVSLLIFFLPLLILPFFNHPFADDFFCGYQLHDKGFIPYQSFIYNNWGGRFAATFTGSLFAYNDFLYNHYYLHSLLLLALNFVSLTLLIQTIFKYILKEHLKVSTSLLYAALFLALEICSLPECSTFIFWFSSAITYQLPLILIEWQILLLILLFNSNNKLVKGICYIKLPLLVFVIIGFNELFIVVQLFLLVAMFYFKLYKKCSAIFIAFILLAFAAATALLIFSPGNYIRSGDIISKHFYVSLVSVAYHSFETLWNICKTPLIWFVLGAVFLYGNYSKEKWQHNFYINKLSSKKWLPVVAMLIFLITCVAIAVAGLKGGIIPDRYINAIVYLFILLLMICVFIAGVTSYSKVLSLRILRKQTFIYVLFSAGLLFNNYIVDVYKSLIIAPTYSNILSERESALKQAAQNNKVAVVEDYNSSLQQMLQTKYSGSTVTFQQLIQQKPPLLFFEDDLQDDHSKNVLKNYYGLDSIIVQQK